jgi:Macro domain
MPSSSSYIRSKIVPKLCHRFAAAQTSTTTTVTPGTKCSSNDSQSHGNPPCRNNIPVCTPPLQQRSVEIWMTNCIVTNFGRHIIPEFNKAKQHPPRSDEHRHTDRNTDRSLPDHRQASPPLPPPPSPPLQRHRNTSQKWILINPCNPDLTGCSRFPYFPKGGPVPKQRVESTTHRDWQPLGYVTQWGGMEVGHGMLYPSSVIDGLVHTYGGSALQRELVYLRQQSYILRQCGVVRWWSNTTTPQQQLPHPHDVIAPCPIGHAVITSAGNDVVAQHYQQIVHTTPPFYNNYHETDTGTTRDPVEVLLSNCYRTALHMTNPKSTSSSSSSSSPALRWFWNKMYNNNNNNTHNNPDGINVAMPLLGAGARAFPLDVACQVAAQSMVRWLSSVPDNDDDDDDNNNNNNNNQHNPTNPPLLSYHHEIFDRARQIHDTDTIPMTTSSAIANDTIRHNETQRETIPHHRVLFGVLETSVADQLASHIVNQIQLHNKERLDRNTSK